MKRDVCYLDDREQLRQEEINRVKLLKRAALGPFKSQAYFTLEELTQLLINSHFVESPEEAARIIPKINGQRLDYGYGLILGHLGIVIIQVKNQNRETIYRISTDHHHLW